MTKYIYCTFFTLLLAMTSIHVFAQKDLDAESPYKALLLENKMLFETGGVERIPTSDGGFILISVAFTSNQNPIHQRTIARSKALREIVAYFEGMDVDSQSTVTEKATTEDDGVSTNLTSTTEWNEKIITRVKGQIKLLPTVATWTPETGVYAMAIGSRFDADGNQITKDARE